MITAQEAKSLMETKREITKDEFLSKHKEFMEKLELSIKEKCVMGESYLVVIVREDDCFSDDEYDFLKDYMSKDLKYMTRGDRKHQTRPLHMRSFEIWWGE